MRRLAGRGGAQFEGPGVESGPGLPGHGGHLRRGGGRYAAGPRDIAGGLGQAEASDPPVDHGRDAAGPVEVPLGGPVEDRLDVMAGQLGRPELGMDGVPLRLGQIAVVVGFGEPGLQPLIGGLKAGGPGGGRVRW